jgi:TRAP-type C4-dicarboxylate transport system permease small subunit
MAVFENQGSASRKHLPLRIDYVLAALMLAVMALITFMNVLGRYLFHFSLSFTEEVTIQLFVWMTVIGAGIAFERGAHLGMITFYRLFPVRARCLIVVMAAILAGLLFLTVDILLVRSIFEELTVFHARSGSLGVPIWIYYAGVPVFSIFVFRGIRRGARRVLNEIH